VAKIEDVARASGSAAEDVFRARLQFLPIGEEQNGIEIALHRALMTEASPAIVERDTPVEPDHVGSSLFHGGQERGAVGAEINDGRASFLQLPHHAGDVGEHVAAIVFHAEASDPTVENLNHVGAGAHLLGGVGRGDDNQFAHQRLPVGGRVVHHFLGVDVVARASAFDHVAGEGERSATKADHGNAVGKMLCDQAHRFGDIAEIGGTVGAQVRDVLLVTNGLLDDGALARGKMKRKTHDFKGQQEVGEDDGGIDAEDFGSRDGDLGGERGLLADLEEGMLLADRTVLGHVSSRLTHEPDGSAVDGLGLAGANKVGIWGRHEVLTVAFLEEACSDRGFALGFYARLRGTTRAPGFRGRRARKVMTQAGIVKGKIELKAADGTKMSAYVARPASGGPYPGLSVFQEAFGVNSHIRSVTDRFAEHGYVAIAPELFHRTSTPGYEGSYTDFPAVMPHMQAVTNETAEADVKAAYEWLHSNSQVKADAISCVGFCMGGRVSFLANSVVPVRKTVSFYGGGIAPGLLDRASKLHGPALLIWGGLDKHIAPEHRKTVTEALDAQHKIYVNIVFSNADYAFFCDERAAYEPVSARQAWPFTLEFLCS
jgi:carboxymethylenebutenolidase